MVRTSRPIPFLVGGCIALASIRRDQDVVSDGVGAMFTSSIQRIKWGKERRARLRHNSALKRQGGARKHVAVDDGSIRSDGQGWDNKHVNWLVAGGGN